LVATLGGRQLVASNADAALDNLSADKAFNVGAELGAIFRSCGNGVALVSAIDN
jgi:hypothetical protein